jgi:hypothetical protein
LSISAIDRRTFLATGLAAVPTFAWSNFPASLEAKPKSLDQRWMPHIQHVEHVGEMRALRNLRDDLFPVTMDRFGYVGGDSIYEQPRHVRLAGKLADHYGIPTRTRQLAHNLEQPPSVFCQSTVFVLPKERSSVQDWWLHASHSAKNNLQLSILFVSSEDTLNQFGVTPSLTLLLLSRIRFRVHANQKAICRSFVKRRSLVQEVNRQIVRSMRDMPF